MKISPGAFGVGRLFNLPRVKESQSDKHVGIPLRVWYIVLACVGIFSFSRLLIRKLPLPSSSAYSAYVSGQLTCPATTTEHTLSHYSTSAGLLTSKDYLNASASDPAPFDFCPVFGPGDAVAERRGQWGLLKSRVHTGSGARIQRVVQKAMSGLPISISILGGSGESHWNDS